MGRRGMGDSGGGHLLSDGDFSCVMATPTGSAGWSSVEYLFRVGPRIPFIAGSSRRWGDLTFERLCESWLGYLL